MPSGRALEAAAVASAVQMHLHMIPGFHWQHRWMLFSKAPQVTEIREKLYQMSGAPNISVVW